MRLPIQTSSVNSFSSVSQNTSRIRPQMDGNSFTTLNWPFYFRRTMTCCRWFMGRRECNTREIPHFHSCSCVGGAPLCEPWVFAPVTNTRIG